MLTDKAGTLQGVDVDSVARQVYGKDALFTTDLANDERVGAIVRYEGYGEGFTILDDVVEIHEV